MGDPVYISGLIMKIRIFINENGFIIFQNILHQDLYTFACAQTNFRSTFSTPIETPPKHGFWMLQQHFLATKIVDPAFFSWCVGIKRSHWVPSQGCTADDPSIRRFGRSKRRWFEPMCTMIRLLLLVFRISSKISGKQMVVYHSELIILRCSSRTVATWPVLPKKQATICFEVLFPRTTFVGFGSFWKTHTVDYCFVSGSYA